MADRTGQQFGNYRLVRLLGQGGYAEVYLGQHLRLNQQAAIKVLHTHLAGQEAERFQREAETIATLMQQSIHPDKLLHTQMLMLYYGCVCPTPKGMR